jgi:hypothetical protein
MALSYDARPTAVATLKDFCSMRPHSEDRLFALCAVAVLGAGRNLPAVHIAALDVDTLIVVGRKKLGRDR